MIPCGMRYQKDDGIETLRGIAIIFLVAAHVVGGDSTKGMNVSAESGLRYLFDSFRFIHVPLFTMISGFVYSLRPVTPGSYFLFVKGKIRIILIPMISVGLIHFMLKSVVKSVNNPERYVSIWKNFIYPNDHFWFLQSLFLIFLIIPLFDRPNSNKPSLLLYILTGSAIVLYLFSDMIPILLGLSGGAFLMVFFIFGLILQRYNVILRSQEILRISIILLGAGIVLIQMKLSGLLYIPGICFDLIELISAFALGFILFKVRRPIGILVYTGSFSFSIYLFHVMFSAASRIIIRDFSPELESLVFFISLGSGIIFSVMLTMVLRKWVITRRVFLGEK